jgi:DNA-directed RNA polymerase
MATIEDQIELEKRMVAYGIGRYRHSVSAAEGHERGADTKYAQRLMHEFIGPVADAIEGFCKVESPGVKAKYKILLRQIDPEKAAYFGLKCLFNHFMQESSVQKLALHIGMLLEDELKFSQFRVEQGDYYDAIIRDFKRKGTKSYRHMHRVLTFKANEKEVQWKSWTMAERAAVGIKVIDCILSSTDLIQKRTSRIKGKTYVEIIPSPEALAWVQDFHSYAEMLNPDRVPCVIPPDDWTSIDQGGFYTPQLRKRSPLVKTRSKEHVKMLEGDISNITIAVNAIQNVAWKVNEPVFDVLQQVWGQALPIGLPRSEPYIIPACPITKDRKKDSLSKKEKERFDEWKAEARAIHTLERDRVSKCFEVVRLLRLANEFKAYEKFWFVHQCDFRGRIYCTVSGLSPQGPDFSKAMLCFAEGKRLTKRGAHWLMVHGANTYGKDKVSYDERVEWVKENEQKILAVAEDALSHKDFWGAADKPYQFLAFCFEYARYKKEGYNMISYLPIGLDGSCNGLQNFSAMLQDDIGGKATNLIPADKPSDIYSEVAAVCTRKLRALDDPMAKLWIEYCDYQPDKTMPRGLAKKPVMTLPYGSTQQSCRESIYKWIMEETKEFFPKDQRFKLSVYLTPILWDAIGDVVVSARKAMDWIQTCASIVAKKNKPLIWWTPIGFPVYQDRKKVLIRRVTTELAGLFHMRVGEGGDKMDVHKNKLGSSPNFVHSMDACHLMLTVHHALQYGVTGFAMIHDDYGTHAADTDTLHQAIREAFVQLYTENDPLTDFKILNEDNGNLVLPDPPDKGTLKLADILDSEYFFG